MTTYECPASLDIETGEATAALVDTLTGNDIATDLEPEELRMFAKAFTQAAQHIEAARR